MISTSDIWSKLRPLALDNHMPQPDPAIKAVIRGHRAPLHFMATESIDGQFDISLSQQVNGKPKNPTDAHVFAFFRWLSVVPMFEIVKSSRKPPRHFIIKEARNQ